MSKPNIAKIANHTRNMEGGKMPKQNHEHERKMFDVAASSLVLTNHQLEMACESACRALDTLSLINFKKLLKDPIIKDRSDLSDVKENDLDEMARETVVYLETGVDGLFLFLSKVKQFKYALRNFEEGFCEIEESDDD